MNRQEFMTKLEDLLAGISEEEKQEALAYYTGYFEDAGEENEEKILKELESPEKVAATIRADLADGANAQGSESAQQESQNVEGNTGTTGNTYNNQGTDQQTYANTGHAADGPQENRTLRLILIITLVIVTSPIWGAAITALGGILIGIIGTLFGAIVSLAAITAGCVIGGCVAVGVGIGTIVSGFLTAGFLSVGIGLLVLALGFVALYLLVLFCGKFFPWAFRGIINIVQRICSWVKKEIRI